jgi:transposase
MIRACSQADVSEIETTSVKSPVAHPMENGTLRGEVGHSPKNTKPQAGQNSDCHTVAELDRRDREVARNLREQFKQLRQQSPFKFRKKSARRKASETIACNLGHPDSLDQASATTPPVSDPAPPASTSVSTSASDASPTADDLTPRLEHEKKVIALCALLRGASNTAAAKEAGVDRRTVFRWRQEEEFQAELHRLQNCFCRAQRVWAAELADESIDVIKEAIDQGKIAPALELVQALTILGGRSFAEIDGLDAATNFEPANGFPAPAPSTSVQPVATQPHPENTSEIIASTPHVQFVSAATESVKPQIQAEMVDLEDLPYNQRLAIAKLISGKCVAEAAQEINLSIPTVERWMRSDESFRQVLRRCRQEQAQRLQCKLLHVSLNALTVLKCALQYNRNVRVAFAVLRGLKLVA